MKGSQSDEDEVPEEVLARAQQHPTGLAQVAAYEQHDDDGLGGEDWRDRGVVWKPPSVEEAERISSEPVFDGGAGSICTDIQQLSSMGVLVGMYFRLIMYSGCFFLLATILAAPALLLNYGGSRIPQEEVDVLQTSLFSLGNLGPSPEAVLAVNVTECLQGSRSEQCDSAFRVEMAFTGLLFDLEDAALIITGVDVLISIGFALLLWFISCRIRHVTSIVGDNNTSAADYSVYVSNLPRDATHEQVLGHFNRLYDLRSPDWTHDGSCCSCCCCCCGRSKTEGRRQYKAPTTAARQIAGEILQIERDALLRAERSGEEPDIDIGLERKQRKELRRCLGPGGTIIAPVLNCENTANKAYLRKWIAEVAMVHPNGDLVRQYKEIQPLLVRIRRARALVRKYSPDSKHSNDKLLIQAEQEREGLERRLDAIHAAALEQSSDDCVGAFVIFQNEESYRRCVADYKGSNTMWGSWMQPKPLRFERQVFRNPPVHVAVTSARVAPAGPTPQHPAPGTAVQARQQPRQLLRLERWPLTVMPAPEPDDVIHENLETPLAERFCRQFMINMCMVLLLVVSFAFIFAAHFAQTQYLDTLPNFAVCASDLPETYWPGQELPETAALRRDRDRDASCRQNGGESVFLEWVASPEDSGAAVIEQEGSFVGAPSTYVPAPAYSNATIQAAAGSEQCFTNLCLSTSSTDRCTMQNGEEVQRSTILACYCFNRLTDAIAKQGIIFGTREIIDSENDSCLAFGQSYAFAQASAIAASLIIVVINLALRYVLQAITRWERHGSTQEELRAVAWKTTISTFLNTALLILLVNARLPVVTDELPSWLPVFSGEFDSMTFRWFAGPGVTIVYTMLINAVVPPFQPLFVDCLLGPIRRCQASYAVTQEEAVQVFEKSVWDASVRLPTLLNTIMVTMFFSAGLPILLPVAAVACFLQYWSEKFVILRQLAKPPPMRAMLIELSLEILPFALLLHAAMALWMYQEEETVVSRPVFGEGSAANRAGLGGIASAYESAIETTAENSDSDLVDRLTRENTLPELIVFLVVLIVLLLKYTVGPLILAVLGRLIAMLTCGYLCTDGKDDEEDEDGMPLLKYNPPYTGLYEAKLEPGVHHFIGSDEHVEGWRIVPDPIRGGRCQKKIRVWPEDGEVMGRPHRRGERMKTWEVISDVSTASYVATANARIAKEVHTLEKGISRAKAIQEWRAQIARQERQEEAMRLQRQARMRMQVGRVHAAAVRKAEQAPGAAILRDLRLGGQGDRGQSGTEDRHSRESQSSVTSAVSRGESKEGAGGAGRRRVGASSAAAPHAEGGGAAASAAAGAGGGGKPVNGEVRPAAAAVGADGGEGAWGAGGGSGDATDDVDDRASAADGSAE